MADLPAEVDVAVDAEIAELELRMTSPREWFHDHAGQERIKELYEQQDSGTTPERQPVAGVQRIFEIESLMADAKGEYWHSKELQNEYRSLIEAKDVSRPGDLLASLVGRIDLADMPADVIGNELMEAEGVTDAELETWGEWTGLDPASIAEGFANAKALWDGMEAVSDPENYAAIREAYTSEMPAECMRGIDREFCMDAPYYEPAGAEDMLKFRGTSAGALAVQGWGDQAEARLGIVQARWDRMTSDLTVDDFQVLDAFMHNKLSPRERAWCWQALAT